MSRPKCRNQSVATEVSQTKKCSDRWIFVHILKKSFTGIWQLLRTFIAGQIYRVATFSFYTIFFDYLASSPNFKQATRFPGASTWCGTSDVLIVMQIDWNQMETLNDVNGLTSVVDFATVNFDNNVWQIFEDHLPSFSQIWQTQIQLTSVQNVWVVRVCVLNFTNKSVIDCSRQWLLRWQKSCVSFSSNLKIPLLWHWSRFINNFLLLNQGRKDSGAWKEKKSLLCQCTQHRYHHHHQANGV